MNFSKKGDTHTLCNEVSLFSHQKFAVTHLEDYEDYQVVASWVACQVVAFRRVAMQCTVYPLNAACVSTECCL